MGTAATESQLQTLLRFTDNLAFVFDGDSAGQKAARKAAETILPLLRSHHEVRILTLPDGLDPDDFVRTHGREAFDELVAKAKPLSFFLRDQLLQESGGAQSPEQRARYQARFQALLKLMGPDSTLSREYWKMFQQALDPIEARSTKSAGQHVAPSPRLHGPRQLVRQRHRSLPGFGRRCALPPTPQFRFGTRSSSC